MSLTSFNFFVFFTFVYLLLLILKLLKKDYNNNIVKLLLLIINFLFIFIADYRYFICVLIFAIITNYIGILIDKNDLNKKRYLILGIVISVLQLGIFKYYNFFVESFSNFLGLDFNIINLILPIGISFYSFSAISYLVDIYNNKCKRQKFIDYFIYLSFFTKLTCGPIVKPQKFFDEYAVAKLSYKNFEIGIQIFVIGLFKKMVIADHLAVFVNDVFDYANAFSSFSVFLAVISYSLQIYFDFSGYSDIVIGLSRILGFNFDLNFNIPYISKNPSEFWKRWHISLSNWLQEYLYIPFGGNRKGKFRTYFNLFCTMLIGGLWHGASWTFIIWGAINGLGLIGHKLYLSFKKTKFDFISNNYVYKIFCILFTFIFTNFCWIFFRADSLNDVFIILNKIFIFKDGITYVFSWLYLAIFVLFLEIIVSYFKSTDKNKINVYYPKLRFSKFVDMTIFIIFCGLTVILAYVGETQFIYGNF